MEWLIDPDLTDLVLMYLAAVGVVLAWECYRSGRIAFLEWRLRRRRDRDPFLSRDEVRDYEWEIARFQREPDTPPLNERLVQVLLELLAVIGLVSMAHYFDWETGLVLFLGLCLFSLFGWVHTLRNRDTDRQTPDPAHGFAGPPDVTMPKEAMHGLVAAVLIVGGFFAWLFWVL